jgi:putative spermidine/putrescine transport system ATP-binding protein
VVELDTFNRPDQPPPPIGSAAEISFAARDVIFIPDDELPLDNRTLKAAT